MQSSPRKNTSEAIYCGKGNQALKASFCMPSARQESMDCTSGKLMTFNLLKILKISLPPDTGRAPAIWEAEISRQIRIEVKGGKEGR
jgi:hypothetical protein